MKHGESKQRFDTGAMRDTHTDKLRYDLITPLGLKRVAQVYTEGAQHYGDRNWEKGIPVSRCLASLERHLMAFKQGDTSEDHLAQMVWNGLAILHYQEAIKLGLLPDTLNDLPCYKQAKSYMDTAAGLVDMGASEPDPRRNLVCMADSSWDVPETNDHIDLHQQTGPVPRNMVRENYFVNRLVELGCPTPVARTIIGGTTFTRAFVEGKTTKWAYVAGPMRGCEKFNFPAFDACRDKLLAQGYNVISPADIDRYCNPVADDPSKVNVSDQTLFVLRDFWSLYFLRKTSSDNAIALLPEWEKSVGAAGEFFMSRWLGLKILDQFGEATPVHLPVQKFAHAHD